MYAIVHWKTRNLKRNVRTSSKSRRLMNVNFDINAMLKSVIEDFQNIARNVKISFKIRRLKDDIFDAFNDTWKTRNLKRNVRTSSKSRRLNDDNHRLNGEYGENRFTALTFINKRQSPACFRAGGIFNNDTGRNLICYQR